MTIALNPSIEKRLTLKKLTIGEEQIIDTYKLLVGRSSVYSAYIIKLLQGDPYVLGFAGGIGGRYIKNFLDRNRIKSNMILKEQELESVFVLELPGEKETRLVDHSAGLQEQDARNFKHKLVGHLKNCKVILLNGQTHDDQALKIMQDTMTLANKSGKHMVLSVEGKEVESFVEQTPYAWIVDDEQLSVLGIQGKEEEKIQQVHQFIISHKIHYAFYLAGQQVVGISKRKICTSKICEKMEKDVLWIKEAMAGGVAVAISRNYEFERMIKLTAGIVGAIHKKENSTICTRKAIDYHMNQCKIIERFSKGHYYFEAESDEIL